MIREIHEVAIEEYGGASGARDAQAPEAIAALAEQAYDYTGDLFEVAAAYVLYVNQRHPWLDGNKRVSAACCIRFLSWNGIATGHSTDGLERVVLAVATVTNQRSRESIAIELRALFG